MRRPSRRRRRGRARSRPGPRSRWATRAAARETSRRCSRYARRGFRCSRRGSAPAPRSAGRSSPEFLELRGVVGPHHDLPVDDDLAVPGEDDEVVRLQGVEVRLVLAGAEGDGRLDGGRLELAHGVEAELHGGAGVAGLVHDQHAATEHDARRAGDHHGAAAGLLARDGHRREIALQDGRHHRPRDDARARDPDHDVGVVLPEDLEGERPAHFTEERPIHLEHAVRRLAHGAARVAGSWRARRGRGRHGGRSYIAQSRGRKLFSAHGFLAPPARRLGRHRTAAPRLSQRGARPRTPGRLRGGAHVVPAGPARSPQRCAHSPEHGHRVHQDASHRRGDPALPPRARAGPRPGGGALRARVPAAQARRSRRRHAAPAGVPRAPPEGTGRPTLDRARHPGAARPGRGRGRGRLGTDPGRRGGGALRAGVLVLVLAAAATCKVSTDLSRNIAIEVTAADSLEEYDTLKPTARVLTGHGAPPPTPAFWFSPDTAIAVLDSTTGRTVVIHTGQTGRLVASGGGLVSNPLAIHTLAAADTVFPAGPTLDTVDVAGPTALDSLSAALKIEIADTLTAGARGNSIVPLAGRPVIS